MLGLVMVAGQAQGAAPDAPPQTAKQIQAEKQHQADIQNDIEQGKKYAESTEKQYKLSTNKEMQARVERIGQEFAQIANTTLVTATWGDRRLNKFDYTYKVIEGDDVNAFSLPGGHVYVFEGLMKQVESDDELAGVLAHETAHASFRHVATLERDQQRLSTLSLPAILAALILASRGSSGNGAGTAITGIQLGVQTAMSGWGVKAEEAADYGGFQYMLHSKYNPTGMLTFMERLAAEEKLGPNIDWGIYRDHPPGKDRAESLTRELKEQGVPMQRSKVTTSFRVTLHSSDTGQVEIDFGKKALISLAGSDALTRGDAAVETLNNFFDTTPELFELQAGPRGTIVWHGRTLLAVTQEDSAAAGISIDALRDKTLQNMRFALFNLGFHVWSTYG